MFGVSDSLIGNKDVTRCKVHCGRRSESKISATTQDGGKTLFSITRGNLIFFPCSYAQVHIYIPPLLSSINADAGAVTEWGVK